MRLHSKTYMDQVKVRSFVWMNARSSLPCWQYFTASSYTRCSPTYFSNIWKELSLLKRHFRIYSSPMKKGLKYKQKICSSLIKGNDWKFRNTCRWHKDVKCADNTGPRSIYTRCIGQPSCRPGWCFTILPNSKHYLSLCRAWKRTPDALRTNSY